MGETSIQWTDYTFNPWIGCARVSPGCVHCYAEARDQRFTRGKNWGPKGTRTRTSPENWRKPLAWNAKAKREGRRYRVFCASLADVFEDRPELVEWRTGLIDLIARTPHLDWLLLTKRPENITRLLRGALQLLESKTETYFCDAAVLLRLWLDGVGDEHGRKTPPFNVWLGTTVEDQQRANERIPELLKVPASVRFLSCEPLLERVDLSPWLDEDRTGFVGLIDWVIIGGESGVGARPFHLEWARDLVNQCRDGGRAEAAPFVKQLGAFAFGRDGRRILTMRDRAKGDMAEWPEDLRVREFPNAE